MNFHPAPLRLFAARAGNFDAPRFVRATSRRLLGMLGAVLLVSCGGGGGGSDSGAAAQPPATGGGGTPTTPTTPTVGAAITDVRIQNTGAAQTSVPFTFGQIVAPGQMASTDGLAATLADGSVVRLQSDIKATHADGSVRHVIVSGVLPSLASGATATLRLAKSTASDRGTETLQSLAASGLTGRVTITIDGVAYTATLADALADTTPETWLSGQVANEWLLDAPLKNAAGATHPLLTTRFYVRWYSGLTRQARVDVVVENAKTFTAGARNLTYNVNVEVGGRSVYSKTALTHYHHSRWHTSAWWDAAREPAVNVQHNTAYLIASKAVSNYDISAAPSESNLAALGRLVSASNTGPMTIGPVLAYMPTTGGRGDIGPLPTWTVRYLLSMDRRARDVMMAAADGSGSWSIHYRDEGTGYPVRTDNEANKAISTHGNLANTGPLPVPRCANGNNSLCQSPYEDDTAHQPSLAYLPYLVTGDYYYLEEMQFWAASNPLATDPVNNGTGRGLVRWQQVRGQAWSLRTLAHSAYITPDSHPLKSYFNAQLDNNLEYYNATYVVGNPNSLGVFDNTGQDPFTEVSPWMDDFLTWSFGYISELGYAKATPVLRWKAKFPVGRMGPEYCWIEGAPYRLQIRDSSGRLFTTFDALYRGNFSGAFRNDDDQVFTHPQGLRFIDQPCASQAQANFLGLANRGVQWPVGRMAGYAGSTEGYPANMQPALAVAATSGITNASQAWTTFANRASKPDYSESPQFAIVPR